VSNVWAIGQTLDVISSERKRYNLKAKPGVRISPLIRPFVVGRKNGLFGDTPKGTMASTQLPHATSVENYGTLLP
jgi:hypothetical protein